MWQCSLYGPQCIVCGQRSGHTQVRCIDGHTQVRCIDGHTQVWCIDGHNTGKVYRWTKPIHNWPHKVFPQHRGHSSLQAWPIHHTCVCPSIHLTCVCPSIHHTCVCPFIRYTRVCVSYTLYRVGSL